MDSTEAIVSRPAAPPLARPTISRSRTAQTGTLAIVIKGATASVVLALQVCLARLLGLEGYGEYAYVFAWMQLVMIFARGGFDVTSLRYIAQYCARGEIELARGFMRRSGQVVFALSLLSGAVLVSLAFAFRQNFSGNMMVCFIIAGATLLPFSQAILCSSAIRGLGSVLLSMLTDLVRPLILLAGLLIVRFGLGFGLSSISAMLLHLLATTVTFGLVFGLHSRRARLCVKAAAPSYRDREWLTAATFLMVTNGVTYLQGRTGVIVSGLLLDARAAGMYAVVERLAEAVLLGMVSVNTLGAPKFAELYAQGRFKDLQRYARMLAWGATAFMSLALLLLLIFGKPILVLFGRDFSSAYPALVLLLVGGAVNAMCGSVDFLLSMTGHHRQLLAIMSVSLLMNLVLSIVLIPRYGILGTACVNAICAVFWNVCMVVSVHKNVGIWPNIGRLTSFRIV